MGVIGKGGPSEVINKMCWQSVRVRDDKGDRTMKGLEASFGTDITRVEVSIQRGTVMLEKGGESYGGDWERGT